MSKSLLAIFNFSEKDIIIIIIIIIVWPIGLFQLQVLQSRAGPSIFWLDGLEFFFVLRKNQSLETNWTFFHPI
jgi:hypothetical protein